jgi:hypothetical protein
VASAVGAAEVKSMRLASVSRVQAARIGVDTYQLALQFQAFLKATNRAPRPNASLMLNCPFL